MSEIKSTMDLIMERTRGMSLSGEERETIRREDMRKRAKGLKLRLTADPERAEEILATLNSEPEEDRNLLESFLWELMVEEMPTDATIFKSLDLLEKLPEARTKTHALQTLRHLCKDMMKDQVLDKKKLLTREKKKLAAMGISGTAVIPKLPKENAISPEFLARMSELRKALQIHTTP